MLDPYRLQSVRARIASLMCCGSGQPGLDWAMEDDVHLYLERLFYGGELAAKCVVIDGQMSLTISGLSPMGLQQLQAY